MADLNDNDKIIIGDYFYHPSTSQIVVYTDYDILQTIESGTTYSGDLYQGDLRPPNNLSGTNIQVKRN